MDVFRELALLGLHPENSVVIGSGILNALGIRENKDIDVVVPYPCYLKLESNTRFMKEMVHDLTLLRDALFEIGIAWYAYGGRRDFTYLHKRSVVLGGVRYISLDFLLKAKQHSSIFDSVRKEKDSADVLLITEYMQQNL